MSGRVSAESEAGFEEVLLRHDVKFVETHRLEPSPIVFGELLEGRPPPALEGTFQQFYGRLRVRGGARSLAQQFETTCVDRVIWNLKHVARWASDDLGVGPKDPTQPREDGFADTPDGSAGGLAAPQLVAQVGLSRRLTPGGPPARRAPNVASGPPIGTAAR